MAKSSYLVVYVIAGMCFLSTLTNTQVAIASTKLSNYYQEMPSIVFNSNYAAPNTAYDTLDINNDGHYDIIVQGYDFPKNGATSYSPQPSIILLGDGDGGFVIAPETMFPVDDFYMIGPGDVLSDDFNGDGWPDLFIACAGWDADPFPGEQNRLFLSQGGPVWKDATGTLPQLTDFTHSADSADVDQDGDIDIFVGNGYLDGDDRILPYMLVNNGKGNFALDRSKIPVDPNSILDTRSDSVFPGSVLADLNGDNYPELILTADTANPPNKILGNTILWNNRGTYSNSNKTVMPAPTIFGSMYTVLDAQPIEINGDGLVDFVSVGTQQDPFYDGWFVQILINKGNFVYEDETTSWIGPGDYYGGIKGVATGTTWPIRIQILDFNYDGLDDFSVEFNETGFKPDMPFVWLNNGEGNFSTLEVVDLIGPNGSQGAIAHINLSPSKHGFNIFSGFYYPEGGGLMAAGMLAKRPYGKNSKVMPAIYMLLLL